MGLLFWAFAIMVGIIAGTLLANLPRAAWIEAAKVVGVMAAMCAPAIYFAVTS